MRTTKAVKNCEKRASNGDRVVVHYKAYFYKNCLLYDDSYERRVPFEVTLGTGKKVKGR